VRQWIAALYGEQHLAASTIQLYFTALKRYEADHETPQAPLHSKRMRDVMEGIRRKDMAHPRTPKLPFTIDQLQRMVANSDRRSRTYKERLFLAAAAIGVGGLLRADDFVYTNPRQCKDPLTLKDVAFFSDEEKASAVPLPRVLGGAAVGYCVLKLKRSKTDQARKGDVAVLAGSHTELLVDFLRVRPETSAETSLLVQEDGSRLTRTDLVPMLREHLAAIGVPPVELPQYTGHSFRRGGAESIQNESAEVIKDAGRWRSDAHLRYHSALTRRLDTARRLGRRE